MNIRGRGGAIITIVSFLISIYATHATSPEARDGKQWKLERNKNPLFQKKLESNDTAKKLETDRSLVYVDNSDGDSLNNLIIRAESDNGKRGKYANSNTKLSRNRRVIITLTTLGALGGGTAVIVGILFLRFLRWMFLSSGGSGAPAMTLMAVIGNLIRRIVTFFPGGTGILNILGFGASAVTTTTTTNNGKTQIPFWLQFQQQSTPHNTFSPNNIGLISNILHWYSDNNEKRPDYDSANSYSTDYYNTNNYQSDYQKNPDDLDYLYPSGDGSVYPSGTGLDTDTDSYGYDYSTDKKNPRVEINQYYQTYPNDQMTKRPRVTTDWTSTTDNWDSDVQSFTNDVENQNSMMLWPLLYPGQMKDAPTEFDRPLSMSTTLGSGLTKNQIIVTGPTKVVVTAGTMYIVFPDPISGETKQIPYDNAYPKYTDPTTKIVYITYNEVKSGNTYIIPQNAEFRCTEGFRKQFRRC